MCSPKLYEQLGDNLRADVVLKVTGKISARDRDGNMGDEAKMIADEISIVTDKELADYESHGRKMAAPTGPGAVTSFRKRSTKRPGAMSAKMPEAIPPPELQLKTVYVHVANPNDHATLLALKKACSLYPGQNDIIMVLGATKVTLFVFHSAWMQSMNFWRASMNSWVRTKSSLNSKCDIDTNYKHC